MLTPADLKDEESGIVVLHETTNLSYWGNLALPSSEPLPVLESVADPIASSHIDVIYAVAPMQGVKAGYHRSAELMTDSQKNTISPTQPPTRNIRRLAGQRAVLDPQGMI